MTGRMNDYPPRIWVAVAQDVAAGYERDALEDWVLSGVVVYGPSTEKVRGLRLRDMERLASVPDSAMAGEGPPTPEQIAEAWRTDAPIAAAAGGLTLMGTATASDAGRVTAIDGVMDEIAKATAPEELTRREGEVPDEFYRRIARAHRALSKGTKRPTMELARKAGVRAGTAAAWVNRSRSRGLYDEEGDRS